MLALVAAIVLVYVAVVLLYAASDRATTIQGCTEKPPPDAVLLALDPESVDPLADRIALNLSVKSFGPIAAADSGLLSEPLTLLVSANDGPRTFTLEAGEIPSPIALRLIADGYVERWPFDAHSVEVTFVSLQTTEGEQRAIATQLCGSAHVPGWNFSSAEIPGTDEIVIDGEPVEQLRITATRSVATVAFGIVLLSLMAVLPALGLTVAILVYRGRRKAEPTLMSWIAAMLFATVPLRTFLPGSPPIGSWVDYLIVLWVVAGLVLALVIYVAGWLRWAPGGGRADAGVPAAGAAAASVSSAPRHFAGESTTPTATPGGEGAD